jgi:hypothetical protein
MLVARHVVVVLGRDESRSVDAITVFAVIYLIAKR